MGNIIKEVSDNAGKVHDAVVQSGKAAVEGVLGLGSNGNRYSQNTADANLPSVSFGNERNSGGGGTEHLSGNERAIAIGKASEKVRELFDEIDGNNNQRLGIKELKRMRDSGSLGQKGRDAIDVVLDNYKEIRNYKDNGSNGKDQFIRRDDIIKAVNLGRRAQAEGQQPGCTPPEVTPPVAPPEVTPPVTPPEVTPPVTPPEVTPPVTPPEVTPPVTPPGPTQPEASNLPRTLLALGADILNRNFKIGDLDGDGFLREREVRILRQRLETPLERNVVGRVLDHFKGFKRANNDQFGREAGISQKDLLARGATPNPDTMA